MNTFTHGDTVYTFLIQVWYTKGKPMIVGIFCAIFYSVRIDFFFLANFRRCRCRIICTQKRVQSAKMLLSKWSKFYLWWRHSIIIIWSTKQSDDKFCTCNSSILLGKLGQHCAKISKDSVAHCSAVHVSVAETINIWETQ